jgi:hypothetical protein
LDTLSFDPHPANIVPIEKHNNSNEQNAVDGTPEARFPIFPPIL